MIKSKKIESGRYMYRGYIISPLREMLTNNLNEHLESVRSLAGFMDELVEQEAITAEERAGVFLVIQKELVSIQCETSRDSILQT